MVRHNHRGQPCRFVTKKRCDQHWREFHHGHHGRPCVMTIGMSKTRKGEPNEKPSCSLISLPEKGQSFASLVASAGITETCCPHI